MDALLERLREIGLGEYEAKVYLALIRRHPATGYELARASGVPSSKVYEVLGRLQEKEVVFVAETGGAKRYIPADPEEFVDRHARRMSRALAGLKEDLQSMTADEQVGYVWNLHGRDALLERATQLLAWRQDRLDFADWHAQPA